MIQLLGTREGPEGDAARTLRDLIAESWPWAEEERGSSIYILAGVKCHGQARRDLDVVLLADLPNRPKYYPFLPFQDPYGGLTTPDEVHVASLCLAIEVKDHDPE